MPNHGSAQPAPAPDAGGNNNSQPVTPQLAVVEPPAPKRRSPSLLNQRQVRQAERARQVCRSAVKPTRAPALESKGIPNTFAPAVDLKLQILLQKSSSAVDFTLDKESATLTESQAKSVLLADLRDLQGAAKQSWEKSNPLKLKEYLVGERIEKSRATLEESAGIIIAKANADRPAGVDTAFILKSQGDLQVYNQEQTKQESEQSSAHGMRSQRNTLLAEVMADCRAIQIAADRAWPFNNKANSGIRKEFLLPLGRPFAV